MESIITSPANERLKHARRVRDGREDGLIFIEGERLVEECLKSGLRMIACYHAPEPAPSAGSLIEDLNKSGCPAFPVAETVLETISDTVNSQGLIVIAKRPVFSLEDLSANNSGEPLIVCLDEVQDPGNFGAIVRTAEAAGASGVIALKGCVDAWAPKTLRSSMGSAFRLPIATEISYEKFIRYADNGSFRIVATLADGETLYTDFDWRDPVIVVFGNEAHGISQELMERCNAGLRIPIREPVESLNVSAAAAAILFEAVRQRT